MCSTSNSGEGHGSNGSPQTNIEEYIYPNQVSINELISDNVPPKYVPTRKHEPGSNWGSENPIKTQAEGQRLLDTGLREGKEVYNVTGDGKVVKFMPDNTPQNGYHAYEVSKPRDIPASVLRRLLEANKISRAEYSRLLRGKK